ncbi:polyisoprenoid-binding protein [Actibacterium mucosum KCTC 23349]|uniref:Polyisoprenoid-binding protein n=1 Tax=Actibacterium mucosum KCTC 23349 TaxID=1454373 RepID=A0A037ZG95_9RHOB|nr:YceI family protein [Actibacterium mucosum]KAJ55168.1 polyisoprenoid-binding protein [Actibacterium mucosum KCTC 23349]
MTILKSTIAALALSAVTMPAMAADEYKLHENHTWVQFAVNHAGWANARGIFRGVSGDIVFDKDDVTKSSVKVTIAAETVDTNDQGRDDHVRSPDFLNALEFPEITFESTRIEQTGDKTAVIYGDMTMVGVTREIALDTTWNAEFPLPWDANTVKTGFTATGSIDGTIFGMNKLTEFGLGPVVEVFIDAEAIKQ